MGIIGNLVFKLFFTIISIPIEILGSRFCSLSHADVRFVHILSFMSQAIQTIDGEIGQQLSLRRKQREGVAPAFYDASVFAQGSIGVLPEALRPKPGHLSLSQQRVYEVFLVLYQIK